MKESSVTVYCAHCRCTFTVTWYVSVAQVYAIVATFASLLKPKKFLLSHRSRYGRSATRPVGRLHSKYITNNSLNSVAVAPHTNKARQRAITSSRYISRSALCCHSNETRAPIANLPKSAQLEGNPYNSPKLHPGMCSSVGMRRGTDRQTHKRP